MRDGTSFSHGLIDFIVLSGNSSKIWLFPIVGIVYGLVYYTIFRVLIAKLDLKTRAVKTPLPSRLHRAVPKCPRRWFRPSAVKKTSLTRCLHHPSARQRGRRVQS